VPHDLLRVRGRALDQLERSTQNDLASANHAAYRDRVVTVSIVVGVVMCGVVAFIATRRRRRTGDAVFSLGTVSPQWLIDHRSEGR